MKLLNKLFTDKIADLVTSIGLAIVCIFLYILIFIILIK